MLRKALTLTLYVLLVFLSSLCNADPKKEAFGYGAVDSARVENGQLILEGWAAAQSHSQKITSLSIFLDKEHIYTGAFERWNRPDVSKIFKREDWSNSGWKLSISLGDLDQGNYKLKVIALTDSGADFKVNNSPSTQKIKVLEIQSERPARLFYLAIIIATFISTAVAFSYSNWLSKKLGKILNREIKESTTSAISLLLLYGVLVGLGTTGSSINLLLKQTPFASAEVRNLFSEDRPIRSDEWRVLTPISISQYYKHFPITNNAYGEEGQNMLIVGMTGTPVWHLSALAKPATWGYFLFDLRRALAWHWWFPVFSCLFALWATLGIINRNKWKINFALSLIFTLSPYSVAWSFWPAYATFFPCLMFVSAYRLLLSDSRLLIILWSLLLGIAAAGFVFILYPPWQVSLGYALIAISIAIIIEHRLYTRVNKYQGLGIFISTVLAATLIYSWWTDASHAIQLMQNTVYPGQRTTVVGGNLTWPIILRGFTNLTNLQSLSSNYSNQSEISSYYFLFLPLACIYTFRLIKGKTRAIEHALVITVLFILFFGLFAIPETLAIYSQWGRVPATRLDLSLGFCTTILTAYYLSNKITSTSPWLPSLATLIASLWSIFITQQLAKLDPSLTATISPPIQLGVALVIGFCSYALITGKIRVYLTLMCGLTLSTVAFFNPLSIAPKALTLAADSPLLLDGHENTRYLVLDNYLPAIAIAATGHKVANAIFYYPQFSLWSRLDPQRTQTSTYNRYQHLMIEADSGYDDYAIQTPYPDIVKIKVNPASFDFKLMGATKLISPAKYGEELAKNPTLKKRGKIDTWVLYDIQ